MLMMAERITLAERMASCCRGYVRMWLHIAQTQPDMRAVAIRAAQDERVNLLSWLAEVKRLRAAADEQKRTQPDTLSVREFFGL